MGCFICCFQLKQPSVRIAHQILVGGLEHVIFHFIYGNFIIPTDAHMFQRGRYTTNQNYCKVSKSNNDSQLNRFFVGSLKMMFIYIVIAGWWFGTWILFSISYMGCHPSHWRTPSFFKIVKTTNQIVSLCIFDSPKKLKLEASIRMMLV
jgi:hypothetical protein